MDWDAWCARSLADEDIVRLILDGTVVRTRIDKRATNVSVLAAIGVRRDGQKVLLAIETWAAKARQPGPASSAIAMHAACVAPSS